MAEKTESVDELTARNNRQKGTIIDLTKELKQATAKINELLIWERFAGHLLHNCELRTVTEENLQLWLSQMLEAEKPAKGKA